MTRPRHRKGDLGVATSRTLPSRKSKTAAIHNLSVVSEAESLPVFEDRLEGSAADEEDQIVQESSAPARQADIEVFQVFSTKTRLHEGLSIVRQLGNGSYEIVNLDRLTADDLTTNKVKNELLSKDGRVCMFDIQASKWDGASFKCHQAIMSAASNIFHFMKLPLEIRFYIYELVLVKEKRLSVVTDRRKISDGFKDATLLRTSKTVYNEAIEFWWKNTFYINYDTMRQQHFLSTSRVQILEIGLDGSHKSDLRIIDLAAQCKNLKSLRVEYGMRILSASVRSKRQYSFQNDDRATKFRQLNGHDTFCSFRGLQKIAVVAAPRAKDLPQSRIKHKDLEDYQEFLMEVVSQPKATKEELAAEEDKRRLEAEAAAEVAAAKLKKQRSLRRRSKFVGDDDEYDGSWD